MILTVFILEDKLVPCLICFLQSLLCLSMDINWVVQFLATSLEFIPQRFSGFLARFITVPLRIVNDVSFIIFYPVARLFIFNAKGVCDFYLFRNRVLNYLQFFLFLCCISIIAEYTFLRNLCFLKLKSQLRLWPMPFRQKVINTHLATFSLVLLNLK